MADFHQGGPITTLHRILDRNPDELAYEMNAFARQRRQTLILPCLYSELETPAMTTIVDGLKKATYIDQIVVGLDRADPQQYLHAREFFKDLPQHVRILWNDGPRLRSVHERLDENGLARYEPGKGRNVWYCLGYTLASGRSSVIGIHDCDIATYTPDLPAKLMYPIANPAFNFAFAKGYYARVANGTLKGRVCRLFVTPLIRALKQVVGKTDFLNYLDCFRYSLSGEMAIRTDVAYGLRVASDWGLEVSMLSEMYRNHTVHRLAQVDIADIYDHKHREFDPAQKDDGLSRMASDIAKSLFRKLATQGTVFTPETFRTLKATYYRMALDLIEQYRADALFNGLKTNRDEEENCVEVLSEVIISAGQHYLENPLESPFIPSWQRVESAIDDIFEQLSGAVEDDLNDDTIGAV
ncbi:glycosyl transferase [Thalassospira sp. MA62]|nr:glycosyl transferase [Thalassospira sp. MA62]